MEQNNSEIIEIDLREIFSVLLHRVWLIILVAGITGASSFAVSYFVITPVYESTTRIFILNKQSESNTLTYSDLQLGTQLTKDYPELITSRYVIENVIDTFELDTTYEQFVKKVSVETPSDTRIVNITVKDEDRVRAKALVNEIRNVAAVRIKEVMDIEAVNVVDEGNVAQKPSEPNVLLWTLIGTLLGIFLTTGFILVRYMLDDTIKSSEDVEKYLQLSTLSLIPIGVSQENDEKANKKKGKMKNIFSKEQKDENESEQ